jgi:hypothetical protein
MLDWHCRQSVPVLQESKMMWNIVEGNWTQFKDTLKAPWRKLTSDRRGLLVGKQVGGGCGIAETLPEAGLANADPPPRRLVLKGAMAWGCSLLLPISLAGCDTRQGASSNGAAPASPPATSPDSDTPATVGKVTQASVQYQPQPKGEQDCAGCMHFEASSSTCTLVEGHISPDGWCNIWVKKA